MLDLKKLSQEFDEFLSSLDKKTIEEWIAIDEMKMNSESQSFAYNKLPILKMRQHATVISSGENNTIAFAA